MLELDLKSGLFLLFELKLKFEYLLLATKILDDLIEFVSRCAFCLGQGVGLRLNVSCLGRDGFKMLVQKGVLLSKLVVAALKLSKHLYVIQCSPISHVLQFL
jgi:hypothetical protein